MSREDLEKHAHLGAWIFGFSFFMCVAVLLDGKPPSLHPLVRDMFCFLAGVSLSGFVMFCASLYAFHQNRKGK